MVHNTVKIIHANHTGDEHKNSFMLYPYSIINHAIIQQRKIPKMIFLKFFIILRYFS